MRQTQTFNDLSVAELSGGSDGGSGDERAPSGFCCLIVAEAAEVAGAARTDDEHDSPTTDRPLLLLAVELEPKLTLAESGEVYVCVRAKTIAGESGIRKSARRNDKGGPLLIAADLMGPHGLDWAEKVADSARSRAKVTPHRHSRIVKRTNRAPNERLAPEFRSLANRKKES